MDHEDYTVFVSETGIIYTGIISTDGQQPPDRLCPTCARRCCIVGTGGDWACRANDCGCSGLDYWLAMDYSHESRWSGLLSFLPVVGIVVLCLLLLRLW